LSMLRLVPLPNRHAKCLLGLSGYGAANGSLIPSKNQKRRKEKVMKNKLAAIITVVLFLVSSVVAVSVRAQNGGIGITIDGILTDGEWDDYFWFTDNSEGPGTGYDDDQFPIFTGYLTFDSECLYLAFDVEDDTPNTNRDFLYVTIDIPPAGEFNEPVDALYWGSIPTKPSLFGEAYLTENPFPWDRIQGPSTWGTDGGVVTARTITDKHRYYELKIPLAAIGASLGDTVGLKVQARDSNYPAFQYVNYYPDMPDGITPIRADTRVEVSENFEHITLEEPIPTIAEAIDDIREVIEHQGIVNSLTSKLQNALNALDRSNTGAFKNILNAFINEVEAQSGKKIEPEYAATLIEWANAWIKNPDSAR